MEKSITSGSEITPSPVYPYPYLFSFSKVKELTYLAVETENSIEFYMDEGSPIFVHLFVVINYLQDIAPQMFFINDISDNSFIVEGVSADQVLNISVYGLEANSISGEIIYPFTNNSTLTEVGVDTWELEKNDILVECSGIWPSSLKYVFAELDTKNGSFFVFLQRPYQSKFVIPEYGKYGIKEIKLFGYHTVMEGKAPIL